ncbi:MAG TPA: hypothetical protein VN642_05815 [Dongiaceae bacterium]|nr:hypothetical protein [Dongiaceae bacterium]
MMKLSILAIILFMFTGCASTKQTNTASPLSGTIWEGTVVSKPYSIPRTKMVNDINVKVKGVDDEYATRFVASIIDEEIPPSQDMISFADNGDCQSKTDYLLLKIKPIVNELSSSVSYILKYNTATGTKVHPSISNTVSTSKRGDGSYLQQLSSDMVWPVERGYAKINVLTTVRCDGKNVADFKVSIPDYSIHNPTLWLGGQKIAELAVDWDSAKRTMDVINKEYVSQDGMKEYTDNVNRVGRNINSKLANRYKKLSRETSKSEERIYKVAPDVMSSRIQRKLESYKFVTDRTRYEFSDKMSYRGTDVDLKTIIKVFPEEGGKTSVVFSLEYSPLHDNIAEKIAFGGDDARKYLAGQIENFEKLIVSR